MGHFPNSGGGGAGTVTSVTATDASIVVAGTAAAPTIATGTLDVIAAQHPAVANWSNNSFKITSVAPATVSGDSVSLQPWQVTPEASGCIADGQLIGDGAITATQNTLTTAGVTTPVTAPTLAHAGTLGLILAGTYQVVYTYVSPFGETAASSSASVTTTGSTSTITVTTPAANGVPGGATGVNYYMTLAGGSTFYKQVTNWPFQNNWELFNPPATTTTPPVSNTTASAPFKLADVGKSIRVIGAGTAGADLLTTISGFTSSTQVTLTANAATTVTANGVAWGTDNTANMNTFLAALQTAASTATNYSAEGVCRSGIYLLATAPVVGGTFGGNCVLQLPSPPDGSPKLKIAIRGGTQDVSTLPVYQQMWPETSGTCFMYIGPAGTNNGTFGAAHVFGTPTNPNIYVNESGTIPGTVNTKIVMDSIRVVAPFAGGIGGFDLTSAAESDNRSCSFQALGIVPSGGSWTRITANGPSTNQFGWGLREPGAGNNAFSYTEQWACEGCCYGYGPSEHLVAVDVFVAYCVTGLEGYAGNSIAMVHNGHIVSAGAEFCSNAVGAFDGTVRMDIDNCRTESTTHILFDPSNHYQGYIKVRDQGAAGAYKSAWVAAGTGTGAYMVNLMTTPGPLSSGAAGDPGPPATTVAWFNYYYLNAWVTVSLSGGTFTSLTIATQNGTQVAEPNAAGGSTYGFVLGSGESYTPTYSAGTLTHTIKLLPT